MHISKLEIENFKGISKLEIEPSKINLFVGRNNTCKSTILESIALGVTAQTGFTDALGESILEHLICNRKHLEYWIREDTTQSDITINISNEERVLILKYIEKRFPADLLGEYKYEFLGHQRALNVPEDKIYEKIIKNFLKKEDVKKQDVESIFGYIETSSKLLLIGKILTKKSSSMAIVLPEPIFDSDEFIITSTPSSPSNLYYYGWSYRPSIITLHNTCAQRGILPQLLAVAKKNLTNLVDFRTIGEDLYIHLSGLGKPLPVEFMGDGFKSILIIALLSALTKDGILVLEEPEATLHPGYIDLAVKHLVKAARDNNTQLFISTHSSELLESLLDHARDEIRIFRIYRAEEDIDYEVLDGKEAVEEIHELKLDLRGV